MKNNFSRMFALGPITVAAMMFAFASSAAAQTESFSFGDLLPGQTGPDNSSIWGNLSVTTGPNYTYTFSLGLNSSFGTLFGSSAYVSEALFNTPSGVDPISASIISGGVSAVDLKTNVPTLSMGFDFGDCFGSGRSCTHGSSSGRLQAGESVTWKTTFSTSQGDPLKFSVPPVALHVQAFNSFNGSTSAWYGVTPPVVAAVPEPQTYAMLLVGLGLVGFSARRRKSRNA